MKDQATKERFIVLRAEGWSFERISNELQVSKPTLIGWSRDFELEIGNLRAVALEALAEKYSLTKIRRLEVLGRSWQALNAELQKRDLSQLLTERLLDFVLKYATTLKEEPPDVAFRKAVNLSAPVDLDRIGGTEQWNA